VGRGGWCFQEVTWEVVESSCVVMGGNAYSLAAQ
jgi:hypothetical protein